MSLYSGINKERIIGKKRTVTKYIPGEIFKFVLFDDGTAAVSTDSMVLEYIPKEITNGKERIKIMDFESKPLKDWTLEECKEYASKRCHVIGACHSCKITSICSEDFNVYEWDLTEKTQFADEEKIALKVLFDGGAEKIEREYDMYLFIHNNNGYRHSLPTNSFQSIKPGQTVTPEDIKD